MTAQRAVSRQQRRLLAAKARAIGYEAAGRWELSILDADICVLHPQIAPLIAQWLDILSDPGIENHLCLLCTVEFDFAGPMPDAFAFLYPANAAPSAAMVSGICPRCATRSDLLSEALTVYRGGLFGGDLRVLPPEHSTADGGRA